MAGPTLVLIKVLPESQTGMLISCISILLTTVINTGMDPA